MGTNRLAQFLHCQRGVVPVKHSVTVRTNRYQISDRIGFSLSSLRQRLAVVNMDKPSSKLRSVCLCHVHFTCLADRAVVGDAFIASIAVSFVLVDEDTNPLPLGPRRRLNFIWEKTSRVAFYNAAPGRLRLTTRSPAWAGGSV